jgi:hypothetical protein
MSGLAHHVGDYPILLPLLAVIDSEFGDFPPA